MLAVALPRLCWPAGKASCGRPRPTPSPTRRQSLGTWPHERAPPSYAHSYTSRSLASVTPRCDSARSARYLKYG
jgi:hypothetical protein